MLHTTYILFVDDDRDDVDLIQECCDKLGYAERARFAASAEELCSTLSTCRTADDLSSLIVLDVNLLQTDGAETLLRLKRYDRYRHIPVVIFSTGSRKKEAFLSLGAEAFYTKSVYFAAVVEQIGAPFSNGCNNLSCAAV